MAAPNRVESSTTPETNRAIDPGNNLCLLQVDAAHADRISADTRFEPKEFRSAFERLSKQLDIDRDGQISLPELKLGKFDAALGPGDARMMHFLQHNYDSLANLQRGSATGIKPELMRQIDYAANHGVSAMLPSLMIEDASHGGYAGLVGGLLITMAARSSLGRAGALGIIGAATIAGIGLGAYSGYRFFQDTYRPNMQNILEDLTFRRARHDQRVLNWRSL